jgi:hypothetical protein
VGSRSNNNGRFSDINQAPPGPGAVQPRRRFSGAMPSLAQLFYYQSDVHTWYDALQLVFQRRLSGGLSFNTHYRLANAEDEVGAPWDTLVLERAAADRDMRHAWVGQLNYALPWGDGLAGVARGLLYGWQVNLIANYQSGEPFTVTNLAARANTGGGDRPDLVGSPELPGGQQTPRRWFNTDAFQAQPLFALGNAPRSVLHGPAQRRLDFSIFKDFVVSGSARLQFRYEIYNALNAANFINPISTLGAAAFGSLTSTGNFTPRQMQFAAKLIF